MIAKETGTKLGTRVAMGVIALLLVGSTIGLYIGMVLGNQDESKKNLTAEQAQMEFTNKTMERDAKVSSQANELSAIWFEKFSGFKSEVRAFNANAVTELTTRDIVVGDGEEITAESSYSAYYIGFLADETIFDSSLNEESLKAPFTVNDGMGAVEGWLQGVVGMRVGGVREMTFPAEMGYGDQEQGSIPANSPLRFIVMIIPLVEDIPYPAGTFDLCMKVNAEYIEQYGEEMVEQYICGAYANEEN